MTYDKFLNFLESFEEIPSFAGRIRAANENLTRLGSGSGRVVYDIDGDKVFKVAKNEKGKAQNEEEVNISAYEYNHDTITKVLEYDNQKHSNWIISEKAKKVGEKRIKELTGIPSLWDLEKYLRNFKERNRGRKFALGIDDAAKESLDNNEWVYKILRVVNDHAQEVGDMGRPSSYGEVIRNGKPTIVLTDYGLSEDTYERHYNPNRKGQKIYELVDMNRGEIYQEFTDGNEIRKSMWALQPYSVSDGQNTINEEFVNFVEARENYMIRRPIFNLMALTEEFHNAINHLPLYVEKAKNGEKFIKNLINLQEYLVEQGVYDRDKILVEEDPPVNQGNLDKKTADFVAQRIAKEVNLPTPKYLDAGGNGFAYKVGDKVLKITTDASEVDSGLKLRRFKPKTIAEIFNIWKVINTQENESYYAIQQEFIKDKPVAKISRMFDVFMISAEDLGMKTSGKPREFTRQFFRFHTRAFDYDQYVDLIKKILYTPNDLKFSDQEKKETYDFMVGLGNIKRDLIKSGIEKGSDYLSVGNLGYNDNILKYFDIGGYIVDDPNIPPENKINLEEEKFNREETEKIVEKIGKHFNVKQMIYLGTGLSGDAYDIGNDVVLKITSDRSEMIESLHLKGKKLKHVADIYAVYEVKSKTNTGSPIYVIMLEKLKTNNNEIELKLDRLKYVFSSIFGLYLWDVIDSFVFNDTDLYAGNKTQIGNYFKKNKQDSDFFYELSEIVKELDANNVDSDDYRGGTNLGYKKDGSVGFFDIGFGDPYQQSPLNPKQLKVDEDGSAKFSTDTSIGRDDFPAYNQHNTEPSIENNLDANRHLYTEEKWSGNAYRVESGYKNARNATAANVVKFEMGQLGNNDDFAHLTPEDFKELESRPASDIIWVTKTLEDAKRYSTELDNSDIDTFQLSGEVIANDGDGGYLVLLDKINEDLEYSHVDDATQDKFELSEDRIKSYMPKSKTVTVKKKCRIGGLGNTSVACNQGDINNLEFGSVNEETDKKNSLTPEIKEFLLSFDSDEQLLRSGGIPIELLDQAAFGFNVESVKKLMPDQLRIKWDDDLENVKYEINHKGLTDQEYAESVDLSEPIDVIYENGEFFIDDGHHRYYAAKVLNKPLNVNLEIKSNPILKLGAGMGYDDFHRYLWKLAQGSNEIINEANIISLQELPFKEDIEKLGGKIYSVGGAVRDEFLGKESKDLDILITGIPMEKLEVMMQPYGKVDAVGKSFGVLKFKPQGGEEIDVAVPRTETATGEGGHKGFDVTSDHTLPIEKDLERRDFTINAIAKDVDGNIVDPFGGQQDLQNKIIRVVNPEAFSDDPLRMLRAVQFASRFDFTIEPKTMEMIKSNARRIWEIPKERVLTEFDKIVKKGDKLTGAQLLQDTGLFREMFGLDLNLASIDKSILNSVKSMGEFIYLLTKSISDPAELYRNDLKGDVETYKEIKALSLGMKDASEAPVTNRSVAHNMYLLSPKSLESKILPQKLQQAATELLIGRFPKTVTELAVNGNDLMQLGFQGKEIGDKLKSLLLNVYAENVRNDKENLLSLLGRKTSNNLNENKYSKTKNSLSHSKSIGKEMKEKILKYLGGGSSYHEGGIVHGLKIPKIKGKRFHGVSLGADKNGFYVYTHRARSESKELPDKIPQKDINFIESTG